MMLPSARLFAFVVIFASGAVPAAVAAPASPVPTPTASARPAAPGHYDRFVLGDLSVAPLVTNEFAPKVTGRTTLGVQLGLEYKLWRGRSFSEAVYRRFSYAHGGTAAGTPNGAVCAGSLAGNPGCVTPIGGKGSVYVLPTRLSEEQFEYHTSLYGGGHAYIATSTMQRRDQYGYPRLGASFGIGAELLPQLERPVGLTASYYYYPEVAGTYTPPGRPSQRLRYKLQTFTVGAHARLSKRGFVELGYYGDHYLSKQNAPDATSHDTANAGVGVHF